MNFTELARTTGLFLMTIVGTGSFRYSLTIGYSRFFKLNLQFLIVLQTPLQRTQMEFALSMHNCLAQFLRLINDPCRIFLTHTVQNSHHLFRIGFVQWFDSTRIFGIRIFNEIKAVLRSLAIQRIAGMHIFQFHSTADVTGYHFFHLDTIGTRTRIDLGDTLLGTTIGIGEIVSLVHFTAHHLEILNITDMRFNSRFKEIQGSRPVCIGFHNLTTRIMHRRHFVYERNNITQELHQTTHTHILACTNAEHREHAARSQSLTDTLTHFVLGQRILLEELLH